MKKIFAIVGAAAAAVTLTACGPSAPRIHCNQINPSQQQLADSRTGAEIEVYDDYGNECELRNNGRFVVDD